jgi:VanZ family protein
VAVLFLLSSTSGLAGPQWFAHQDKVAHLGLYTLLGAVLGNARITSVRRGLPVAPAPVLLVLGMALGALDEVYQSTVPGRMPSAADWVADALGVTLGFVLVLVLRNSFARTPPHV